MAKYNCRNSCPYPPPTTIFTNPTAEAPSKRLPFPTPSFGSKPPCFDTRTSASFRASDLFLSSLKISHYFDHFLFLSPCYLSSRTPISLSPIGTPNAPVYDRLGGSVSSFNGGHLSAPLWVYTPFFSLNETLIFYPQEPFLMEMQICAWVLALYSWAALSQLLEL